MDRNYIIYNNHPFTLIWHLAFGKKGVPQIFRLRHSLSIIQRISSTFDYLWSILFSPSSSSYNSIVFPSEEIETEKTAVFISPVSLAKVFLFPPTILFPTHGLSHTVHCFAKSSGDPVIVPPELIRPRCQQ